MAEYTSNVGAQTTSDDYVVVDPGIAVGGANAAIGLNCTTDDTQVEIFGTVWGSSGLKMTQSGLNEIDVKASGSVEALGDAAVNAGFEYLTNAGSIDGAVVTAVGEIDNYGRMVGSYNSGAINTTGNVVVFNSGTMSGQSKVVVVNGTLSLTNLGSMSVLSSHNSTSSVISASASSTMDITNYGIISVSGDNGSAIIGGDHNDFVVNSGTIFGKVSLGGGDDTYNGKLGTLSGTLDLGAGNDSAVGGSGADTILGGDGNDTIDGGAGADSMVGGAGNDTFYVDNAADRVIEASGGGNDTVITTVSYSLRAGQEIEHLIASGDTFGLSLTGNEYAQTITGDGGANRITGGGGADTLIGGGGDDTYIVSDARTVVTETASNGYDTIITGVSYTLPTNVEVLKAAPHISSDLTLTGNGQADVITGGDGNDTIVGGGGADTMSGGAGNDTYVVDNVQDVVLADRVGNNTIQSSVSFTLPAGVATLVLTGTADINGTGTLSNETITGNSGANVLSGHGGLDTLTGGGGADTFYFDVGPRAGTLATITDFTPGTDHIELASAGFRGIGGPGALDPAYFTPGNPTTTSQHIVYDSSSGTIYYDLDGSGARAPVAFAHVTPGTALSASDFIVG